MGKKAAPTRIQKSGRGHTYYLDGEWAPGVTTVLGNGFPKPGLINWASDMVSDFVVNRLQVATNAEGKKRIVADELVKDLLDWNASRDAGRVRVSTSDVLPRQAIGEILSKIRERDLDEASGKGTDVHRLAEQLGRGETITVPDAIAGHVRSYLRFLEEWKPRDAILEGVIVNRRWHYMGKFDLLATVDLPAGHPLAVVLGRPEGGTFRILFDIKTSRSGIFSDVALQLVGYANGETMLWGDTEVPMEKVDGVAAIHVRGDGYDVIGFDIETKKRPTTFDIFLYVKQVADWSDWKKGPASTIRTDRLPAPFPTNPTDEETTG